MATEVINGFGAGLVEGYSAFITTLPNWAQNFIGFLILVVLIVIYSVFVWKFYRFIATKNIFHLNLHKYNKSEHPVTTKLIATGLYLLEYIIILPFLIFFWYAIFTLFLIFLTESLELQTVLIVSATIIAAIRMTSYIPRWGEDLAKEIAKMIPFMLLVISLLNPEFFSVSRILSHLSQIPDFFGSIIYFLIFIVVIEVILRFFDFLFQVLGISEDVPESQKVKG